VIRSPLFTEVMEFHVFGQEGAPSLLLIPGLGVSDEIFLPLADLLKDRFLIITTGIDGFLIGHKPQSGTRLFVPLTDTA
jgi:hypothetical protein